MVIARIGIAEIGLVLVVGLVLVATFVGLVALGVRLGTRDLRKRS